MTLAKVDRHNLDQAIERLAIFCDPDDERCAVPAAVREAARIYLSTWVAGPLNEIAMRDDNPTRPAYDWKTGQEIWPRMRS